MAKLIFWTSKSNTDAIASAIIMADFEQLTVTLKRRHIV